MSSDKIYLNREEKEFLMEMLELKDPMDAVEAFAEIMVQEGADPLKLQRYVSKIIKRNKK